MKANVKAVHFIADVKIDVNNLMAAETHDKFIYCNITVHFVSFQIAHKSIIKHRNSETIWTLSSRDDLR